MVNLDSDRERLDGRTRARQLIEKEKKLIGMPRASFDELNQKSLKRRIPLENSGL